jgi:cytochrome c biogenesis protein CcmG/thiol:disulfide interchange protein DsbE
LPKLFLIPALAVAAIVAIYFVGKGAAPASLQRELAPDFTLPDLTNQPVRLSSFRGKVVLLDFWATWCEPCRDEIPHFIQLQNQYGSAGLQVIGISMDDSADPVRDFYQRFRMNYPVVMGNAKTGELYGGVLGLPIAFLIGRDGRIAAKHIGATDAAILEKEIKNLLAAPEPHTE